MIHCIDSKIGGIVRHIGPAKVVLAGVLAESVSLFAIAFTDLIRDAIFVAVSVILRAIAGCGSALYMVACTCMHFLGWIAKF